MRLTWIRQQFGRDALCEGHYAAEVDQAMVRPSALCEGHYAANVDQATVWHCKNSTILVSHSSQ